MFFVDVGEMLKCLICIVAAAEKLFHYVDIVFLHLNITFVLKYWSLGSFT